MVHDCQVQQTAFVEHAIYAPARMFRISWYFVCVCLLFGVLAVSVSVFFICSCLTCVRRFRNIQDFNLVVLFVSFSVVPFSVA